MDATHQPSQQLINAQKELARRRRLAGVKAPLSLGASERSPAGAEQPAVTDHLSMAKGRSAIHERQPAAKEFATALADLRIRLSPTLAATCLNREHRHNDAALDGPYRLYKILGALDEQGRGWLAGRAVEALLTRKESGFFIYGRRQLKIMLRRGEGLFWHRVRSKGQLRIRLVSRTKVALALDCGRLRGREVSFPLAYLLGSGRGRQAQANAALYAAIHAGHLRPDSDHSQAKKPRPISRAKLQELAGCSRYRQRSYERRMQIGVQANLHILGEYNEYKLVRARRHLGLPAYKHLDPLGKVNPHKRGAAYIAVRLPNSYRIPDALSVVQSRRQRTINRSLDGLCHMGSGGSDRDEMVRLFHHDAATAVRAAQRNQEIPAYWPLLNKGALSGSAARLWLSCTAAEPPGANAPGGPIVKNRNQPSTGGDLD